MGAGTLYQQRGAKMRLATCALLATLLTLLCARAMALDPALQVTQYVVDTWQTAEGLPLNSVEAIARTPDGYLWIGTQEGLARFDGNRFTVFDRSTEAALPDKWISALYVDVSGRLWIGTRGGMAIFENGRFSPYNQVASLMHASIRVILKDSTGRIWVGTETGLVEIDGESSRVFGTADGLRDSSIEALLEDRNHVLWVSTATGGLHRLVGDKIETPQVGLDASAGRVSAMYQDRDGSLWLGTQSGRLYQGTGNQGRVAMIGQVQGAVRALMQDRDRNLWITTYGGGLVRLRNGSLASLKSSRFASNDLHSLYEDNEGSLWIGTYGDGLLRLRDAKVASFGETEGLDGSSAWTIIPRARGGIWIGTDAGLSAYDGKSFQHIAAPTGFDKVRVRSLLEDRQGNLWVGTDGAGVYSRNGDRVTIFDRRNGLSGTSVKSIAEDREGRIWLGTDMGLDVFEHGKITSMQHLLQLSGPSIIRLLHEDSSGKLWITTQAQGLFVIDGSTTRHYGLTDGLPSTGVSAIYEDERGFVWLGTTDGLAVWRAGKIISLAGAAGPLHETILRVLEDDRHQMWFTTNRGLVSVSRETLDALATGDSVSPSFHVYGIADGLRSAEFDGGNNDAGCRTPDGRLWFPSNRGIVAVDPLHIRTNSVPPPVQIEQVTVDAKSLPNLSGLKVNAGQQQWEFHYTALSLMAAQQARFKYRLEGFDEQWIDAGNRRIAYYTRLPAGTFTFHVIASNNDGVWNNSGTTFSFTVKPHFYQTWWFILICAALVLLLARAWHQWRVRQLRRLADTLSAQVADRTRDLKMANQQMREAQDTLVTTARQAGMAEIANNVLHNVGNVLNSVNVSAELIGSKLRDSKSAGLAKAVSLMNEHSSDLGAFITADERGKALPGYFNKLVAALAQEKQAVADELNSLTKSVDHIKEIVATQQSYSGATSVIEPVQVKDLLEDALRMNAGSIAHHQISIVKDFAEVPLVPLDKHLMLQILINLIGNAKHALNGGSQQPHQMTLKVDIADTSGPPRLRIRIEDNGEGIAPENLTRLFAHGFTTRKNGHGFGLHSCALAVKEMKGSITAFSDGLGRGAAFVLELPINRVPESA
jgi:ligand-binding sensor domain-containing protein/signal transduction histidine kinase